MGGGFGAILKVCLTYFGGVVSRLFVFIWDLLWKSFGYHQAHNKLSVCYCILLGIAMRLLCNYCGDCRGNTVVMLWDCCGDCRGEIAVMAWQWWHFCENYLVLLWSCCGFVARWLWDCCVVIAVGMLWDYCEITAKLL